jgi:hypothetical protein
MYTVYTYTVLVSPTMNRIQMPEQSLLTFDHAKVVDRPQSEYFDIEIIYLPTSLTLSTLGSAKT